MGMDMTLDIISKEGEYIKHDIVDFRSSDWFENMNGWGRGYSPEFNYFYPETGIPELVPMEVRERYEDSTIPAEGENVYDRKYYGYFNFRYCTVKAWKDFFEKYKPNVSAGWITKYDKFLWDFKGMTPDEDNIVRFLSSVPVEDRADYEFCHFVEEYDNSAWLYNYIIDHNIPDDAYLVYCFDW